MSADVIVTDEGSVWAFDFRSEDAREWLDATVEYESWQWLGHRLVVDHRCAAMLVEGFEEAGFDVEME
jgi:hypothetical protein